MALVALAGPAANLAMAFGWALVMTIGINLVSVLPHWGQPLTYMGGTGITINIVIGVLNMLPVPPLDGSRVLMGLLPNALGIWLARLEPFGLVILLLLLATGLLGAILGPPVFWLRDVILAIFGY
jgi:Zn-dependent protease